MKKKITIHIIFFMILLSGCNTFKKNNLYNKKKTYISNICSKKSIHLWSNIIIHSANKYNIDKKLIKSIICLESSGNERALSHSKAIGLMQIKPFSAGKEVYRFRGRLDQPSNTDLYNPKINIDIGTAYLYILQTKSLLGIRNLEILRYATVVSYVNGFNKLLRTFSFNRKKAINQINNMNVQEFLDHVKKNILIIKPGIILKNLF